MRLAESCPKYPDMPAEVISLQATIQQKYQHILILYSNIRDIRNISALQQLNSSYKYLKGRGIMYMKNHHCPKNLEGSASKC